MAFRSIITIFAFTAGSFFALGAYYQHYNVMRNIKRLEQRNPHAYFIRRKLYALLNFFGYCPVIENSNKNDEEKHKFGGIMKYGFPSMNDITLDESFDFVTSFDRRNSAIQWMCERMEKTCYGLNQNLDIGGHSLGMSPAQLCGQTEASRVFFLSNIKPFISRGINLTIWNRLQSYLRELADCHGTIYVYTGSIYMPCEIKTNNWYLQYQPENNTMVAVPTHFFKIIIIDPKHAHNITPYAEAFVIPNAPVADTVPLKSFLSDVRDIENATGLRFFEGLDRNFVHNQSEMELNPITPQNIQI